VGLKGKMADVIYSQESGLADPDQRYLASYFLKRANAGMQCFPSLDTIQRDTMLPRKRVVRAITGLEAAPGPVSLDVRRGCRRDGPGRAVNLYTLLVDLSAAEALKSAREQSAASALKSPPVTRSVTRSELSAELSAVPPPAECQNGGHLSADVDPGSLSGNSYKNRTLSGVEAARPRRARPALSFKGDFPTPEQREREQAKKEADEHWARKKKAYEQIAQLRREEAAEAAAAEAAAANEPLGGDRPF